MRLCRTSYFLLFGKGLSTLTFFSVFLQVVHSSCQRLAWVPFEQDGEGLDDDLDPLQPSSFHPHTQRLLEEAQQEQPQEKKRKPSAFRKSWSTKVQATRRQRAREFVFCTTRQRVVSFISAPPETLNQFLTTFALPLLVPFLF